MVCIGLHSWAVCEGWIGVASSQPWLCSSLGLLLVLDKTGTARCHLRDTMCSALVSSHAGMPCTAAVPSVHPKGFSDAASCAPGVASDCVRQPVGKLRSLNLQVVLPPWHHGTVLYYAGPSGASIMGFGCIWSHLPRHI